MVFFFSKVILFSTFFTNIVFLDSFVFDKFICFCRGICEKEKSVLNAPYSLHPSCVQPDATVKRGPVVCEILWKMTTLILSYSIIM